MFPARSVTVATQVYVVPLVNPVVSNVISLFPTIISGFVTTIPFSIGTHPPVNDTVPSFNELMVTTGLFVGSVIAVSSAIVDGFVSTVNDGIAMLSLTTSTTLVSTISQSL